MGWQRPMRRAASHKPLDRSVGGQRLDRIGRAGRLVAAGRRQQRRQKQPIGLIGSHKRGHRDLAQQQWQADASREPSGVVADRRPEPGVGRLECAGEIGEQPSIGPGQRLAPGDENIVIAPLPIKGEQGRSRRPQAPLGAVALDRAADLAAGRIADAQMAGGREFLRRGAGFQRERGGCGGGRPSGRAGNRRGS